MTINAIVPEASRGTYESMHFAPAVEHDGVIYCSGVIGTDTERNIPEAVEDEFRNAWAGVGRTLEAAGAGFKDIVELTSYHVGLQGHIGKFMKIKNEFIPDEPYPAWTAIGITELAIPGARVEIRVIARKP